MLYDERCPECRGEPELLIVTPSKMRKRCVECGHKWSEERVKPLCERKGYVDITPVKGF